MQSTPLANRTSRIAGFHKKSPRERLDLVAAFADLSDSEVAHLAEFGNLAPDLADRLIENVVGTMTIPLGIATNMRIDGEDVLIPMATEESSVVAAVCNAARQVYEDGFTTSVSGNLMIAQVQAVGVSDPHAARLRILEQREALRALCDACDPVLVRLGDLAQLHAGVVEPRQRLPEFFLFELRHSPFSFFHLHRNPISRRFCGRVGMLASEVNRLRDA